jgi:hypothetical protein
MDRSPWVRSIARHQAIAGPDTLLLRTAADMRGVDLHGGQFTVAAGETWASISRGIRRTSRCPRNAMRGRHPRHHRMVGGVVRAVHAPWPVARAVLRSLITLKAMTFAPTGGIVASPTTSLPEFIGGVRNWDYRYCWVDATFTPALMMSGYIDEARAWRIGSCGQSRAIPARSDHVRLAGERRLAELTLGWLPATRGLAARAPQQRRPPATPARHLRRGDGRAPRRAA